VLKLAPKKDTSPIRLPENAKNALIIAILAQEEEQENAHSAQTHSSSTKEIAS